MTGLIATDQPTQLLISSSVIASSTLVHIWLNRVIITVDIQTDCQTYNAVSTVYISGTEILGIITSQ